MTKRRMNQLLVKLNKVDELHELVMNKQRKKARAALKRDYKQISNANANDIFKLTCAHIKKLMGELNDE